MQHFVHWNKYVLTTVFGDFCEYIYGDIDPGFLIHISFQSMYILLSVLKL